MFPVINSCKKLLLAASLLLPFAGVTAAAEFHNALSLQGFTGILNTPNARVTAEKQLYLLYSNQEESQWRQRVGFQDNYLISLGLFNRIEVGGRFFESPGAGRDLSFNGKLNIPFIPADGYLPQLAVGVQDISGGRDANKLKTYYAVASQELWRFRFSLGYGTGPKRMDGVFGGVEVKACDWLYLLADNDTSETNVGARIVTPGMFGQPLQLQLTAKTSVDYRPGSFELAFGLQLPLGLEHQSSTPIAAAALAPEPQSPAAAITTPFESATTSEPPGVSQSAGGTRSLQLLLGMLRSHGFQNLRIGTRGAELLVVEFENSRYRQNELDGIGVVAGTLLRHLPAGFKEVRLISKQKNLRMLQLTAPVEELRAFYGDAGTAAQLQAKLRISEDIDSDSDVVYLQGESGASWLTSSLMLYPGLKTYLGTELAPLDYLLSIKPDLTVNIWQGGAINARWDIPLSWSENFDKSTAFRSERENSRLERLLLYQAFKPAPGLMALAGAGMTSADSYGTINEALWSPAAGAHRVRLMHGFAAARDRQQRESYLLGYRYHLSPLDTTLEATAGRFWSRDTGFMLEMKRFFGDTAVTLYFKRAQAADKLTHQAVGVQFSLPLTPRQEMKPGLLQLRGTEEWSYAQESEIARKGSWNYVGTTIGARAETTYNLSRIFYNRDRLSEAYIRKHLLRLRDAYLTYGAGKP